MTRVRTAKGSLYLQCWGLPLFLLNCFSINKYICLYVYDTLGTMQVSIHYKVLAKRYTAIAHLRSVGASLSCLYTLEVSYLNLLVDSIFSYTSIDLSSEMPPLVEREGDVIDDEVVSFSFSYTVVYLCQDWLLTKLVFLYISGPAIRCDLYCCFNFFKFS